MLDHEDLKYFFIVGCPRSGTTLLSVLLDRHHQICVTPETNFFNEIAPYIKENDLIELEKLLNQWKRLPELNLNSKKVLEKISTKNEVSTRTVLLALLDLYTENQSKQICGEKTPQHLEYVNQILHFLPEAKIICLLRDGRDVALSLMSMPWWLPRSLPQAALFWKDYVKKMEIYQNLYSKQFKVFKYEQLVNSPEDTLTEITNFLGVKIDINQFNTDIPSNVVLIRSFNWKGKALDDINPKTATFRREKSSLEDILILENLLKEELIKYDYL